MPLSEYRLPAEWEPQRATLLAWPPQHSDWEPRLEAIRDEYRELILAVLEFQPVWLLVQQNEAPPSGLPEHPDLLLIPAAYDDTWCRDYGPLLFNGPGGQRALDFRFDGWGGKFAAAQDDAINHFLHRYGPLQSLPRQRHEFVLEGGAIDSDGQGQLLINRYCMRTRWPDLDEASIDARLLAHLPAKRILAIDIEPVHGDDTDGHIDILARLLGPDSLVWQSQADPERNARLLLQLQALRTADGRPFRLLALPVADDVDPELPASYVNYLLVNGGCLVPAFNSRHDEAARRILAAAWPGRQTRLVSALQLIHQAGGPRCASMHLPAPDAPGAL